jgi:hypothetical protein
MVQGLAKVGAVIGGFVHGLVNQRATRHDSGSGVWLVARYRCVAGVIELNDFKVIYINTN